jgi:hypothetical protein
MSDTQIIAATIQVDTGSSNANILAVNKNLTDVKSNLKDTGATAANTGKAIEGSTGSFGKLKEQMTALPGPLGAAGEGVNKLSLTFKALLANPIVLLIAAVVAGLALLYKAFANTFGGGEKMEQVFASIKAAGQALLDSLGHIAKAAYDIFTFHWGDAIDEIKGVAKAMGDAYDAAGKLTKQMQDLGREQAANDLDQANRNKRLAVLREQAYDDSIPIAKRRALLKELKTDAEADAKNDIDLAKRVAENKIAQLELEKDGYKKNFAEIQKIKAEQVNVETASATELRRIDKQISTADKQDAADKKEAAKAGQEAAKAARVKLTEYNNALRKLQQQNELLSIKDAYEKEVKALENKISDEKRANLQAFNDHKLTKAQYNTIEAQLDIQADLERTGLTEKHNKEIATKEESFQKELNAIVNKTKLDGIKDARAAEKIQLQIGYEEKLAAAIKSYKDDAVKLQAIKNALDDQLKADQAKLDAKFKKEDDKKKFDVEAQKLKAIIDGKASDAKAKLLAVKAEQDLVQQAFDAKIISELEYNTKVAELSGKRKEIADLETAHKKAQVDEISGTLSALADLVGKQTIAGKALAIATALINTYQGASEVIKQKSTLPSPFDIVAKVVGVAAVIATGLKTVKAITAVQVPGGGGGGSIGSAPSINVPAPVAPVQGSTALNQASLNSIGSASSKTYVLDSDVANNRERDIRLNRAARLGG